MPQVKPSKFTSPATIARRIMRHLEPLPLEDQRRVLAALQLLVGRLDEDERP